MSRMLCSTGTMIGRPNNRDYHLLRDCPSRLQYDGLEFMLYDTWYPLMDDLTLVLDQLHLPIPVMHCEKSIGEDVCRGETQDALQKFEINCSLAQHLGAKKMVLHLWNGPLSDQHMDRALAAYLPLKDIALSHGLLLTIENVVCTVSDPLTHWREILEIDPEALFTFDTKMAAFHDQLDAMYTPKNRDLWPHIIHVHVNDYGGGYKDWSNLRTLHPGQGHIQFTPFFDHLRTIHYTGDFTIEATSFIPDGIIRWDDLNKTGNWFRSCWK